LVEGEGEGLAAFPFFLWHVLVFIHVFAVPSTGTTLQRVLGEVAVYPTVRLYELPTA
jgi:hypothetical protein